ncbi:MAG: hypothetical protein ABEJ71_02910 [Halodesulfurarchaeum sp.]
MHRRRLLTGIPLLVTPLAGCQRDPRSSQDHPRYSITGFEVSQPTEARVSFDAALIQSTLAPDRRAKILLAVENPGTTPVYIRSGPNPPFGVPRAVHRSDGNVDATLVLWQDEYRQPGDGIEVHDGEVSVAETHTWTELPPSRSTSEIFEIRYDRERLTTGVFRVSRAHRTATRLPPSALRSVAYEIRFRIETPETDRWV